MTLIVAPDADANSYLSVAEFDLYLAGRIGGATVSALTVAVKERLLIQATRTLDAVFAGTRKFVGGCECPHFETSPQWTGTPTSAAQTLSWPRTGVYSRNGALLSDSIIPVELKDATAEFAFQLYTTDSTLDNAVAVQGISSIRAGSVALTFRDSVAVTKVLPDAVLWMLVPGWLTDTVFDYLSQAEFDVI